MEDLRRMDIDLVPKRYSYMLSTLTIQPSIVDKIKEGQASDPALLKIKDEVIQQKRPEFNLAGDETLRFGAHMCVPSIEEIRRKS